MPGAGEVAGEKGRWELDSGFRILVDWMWDITDKGEPKITSQIWS